MFKFGFITKFIVELPTILIVENVCPIKYASHMEADIMFNTISWLEDMVEIVEVTCGVIWTWVVCVVGVWLEICGKLFESYKLIRTFWILHGTLKLKEPILQLQDVDE